MFVFFFTININLNCESRPFHNSHWRPWPLLLFILIGRWTVCQRASTMATAAVVIFGLSRPPSRILVCLFLAPKFNGARACRRPSLPLRLKTEIGGHNGAIRNEEKYNHVSNNGLKKSVNRCCKFIYLIASSWL